MTWKDGSFILFFTNDKAVLGIKMTVVKAISFFLSKSTINHNNYFYYQPTLLALVLDLLSSH